MTLSLLLVATLATACHTPQPTEEPTPAFGGATGPNGIVDVNYTVTDPDIGYTLTIQKADTTWIDSSTVVGPGALPPGSIITGLRLSYDISNMNTKDYAPKPWDRLFALWLSSDPALPTDDPEYLRRHTASCDNWWKGEGSQAVNDAVLKAIGGDIPLHWDTSKPKNEGWLYCYAYAQDTPFFYNQPGYLVNSGAIYIDGPQENIPSTAGTSFTLRISRAPVTP